MIPFSGAILRLIVNRKVSCPHAFLGGVCTCAEHSDCTSPGFQAEGVCVCCVCAQCSFESVQKHSLLTCRIRAMLCVSHTLVSFLVCSSPSTPNRGKALHFLPFFCSELFPPLGEKYCTIGKVVFFLITR